MQHNPDNDLPDLPAETWSHILTFLQANHLGTVAQVSKAMLALSSSKPLWRHITGGYTKEKYKKFRYAFLYARIEDMNSFSQERFVEFLTKNPGGFVFIKNMRFEGLKEAFAKHQEISALGEPPIHWVPILIRYKSRFPNEENQIVKISAFALPNQNQLTCLDKWFELNSFCLRRGEGKIKSISESIAVSGSAASGYLSSNKNVYDIFLIDEQDIPRDKNNHRNKIPALCLPSALDFFKIKEAKQVVQAPEKDMELTQDRYDEPPAGPSSKEQSHCCGV